MYTADATKPAYDSQPGPLDPFTTGLIQIVIEPPEQRRLENTSICCPSRPTSDTEPAIKPAMIETSPSALL